MQTRRRNTSNKDWKLKRAVYFFVSAKFLGLKGKPTYHLEKLFLVTGLLPRQVSLQATKLASQPLGTATTNSPRRGQSFCRRRRHHGPSTTSKERGKRFCRLYSVHHQITSTCVGFVQLLAANFTMEPRARAAKNRGQQNFTDQERVYFPHPRRLRILIPSSANASLRPRRCPKLPPRNNPRAR